MMDILLLALTQMKIGMGLLPTIFSSASDHQKKINLIVY